MLKIKSLPSTKTISHQSEMTVECPFCQAQLSICEGFTKCSCLKDAGQVFYELRLHLETFRKLQGRLFGFTYPKPKLTWAWANDSISGVRQHIFFVPAGQAILSGEKHLDLLFEPQIAYDQHPINGYKRYVFPISDLPFDLTLDNLSLLWQFLEKMDQKWSVFL